MSRTERNFTPIAEIDGTTTEIKRRKLGSTHVLVDLSRLPRYEENDQDILREGIGLNIRAIGRRAMISGIDTVRIQTQTGDTTSHSPTMVGINPDGSAIRGLISRKTRIATGTAEAEGKQLTIKLNTSEIKRRLEEKDIPLRSQEGWAKEMNRAIELAFMKHQLKTMKRPLLIIDAVPTVVGIHGLKAGLLDAFTLFIVGDVFMNVALYVGAKSEGRNQRQIFPFEKILSSLALSGKDSILGTQSVVRALPQK